MCDLFYGIYFGFLWLSILLALNLRLYEIYFYMYIAPKSPLFIFYSMGLPIFVTWTSVWVSLGVRVPYTRRNDSKLTTAVDGSRFVCTLNDYYPCHSWLLSLCVCCLSWTKSTTKMCCRDFNTRDWKQSSRLETHRRSESAAKHDKQNKINPQVAWQMHFNTIMM